MAGWNQWIKVLLMMEDRIVAGILRQPGWHRFVGRIHRSINERRFGRNPNEPLRQGEATKDPNEPNAAFWRYFVDEMKNQARGTPTESPPPKAKPPQKSSWFRS